jgi:hypothetical protein
MRKWIEILTAIFIALFVTWACVYIIKFIVWIY